MEEDFTGFVTALDRAHAALVALNNAVAVNDWRRASDLAAAIAAGMKALEEAFRATDAYFEDLDWDVFARNHAPPEDPS